MINKQVTNVFVEDGLENLIKESIPRIQVDRIPAICSGCTGTLVASMDGEEVAKIVGRACDAVERVGSINGDSKYARIAGTGIIVEVVAILKKL